MKGESSFLNDTQMQCLKILVQTSVDTRLSKWDNFEALQQVLSNFSTEKDKFVLTWQSPCTVGILWNDTIQFFTQL